MTELCTNSIRILDIIYGTSVDGPGLRTSIYGAGCIHQCPGCHNPQSWDPQGGRVYDIDALADMVAHEEMDVTFTGGDPMAQPQAFASLAQALRARGVKNIWCYTGYMFDHLLDDPQLRQLLECVDVVVDGRFEEPLRDTALRFRGSSNQRIIDVRASIGSGQVVLWQPQARLSCL